MNHKHPDKNLTQRTMLFHSNPTSTVYLCILCGKASLKSTPCRCGGEVVEWRRGHDYKHFTKNASVQIIKGKPPKGKVIGHHTIPSLTYILIKLNKNGIINAGAIMDAKTLEIFKLNVNTKIYLG